MEKGKRFTNEEKAAYLHYLDQEQKDEEYNKKTSNEEKRIKCYLILVESGLTAGLTMITVFNWNFKWVLDINEWLTNILVPIIIFNFLTSIWLIIEKKKRRIPLWLRLLFYFFNLLITFFVSASLRLEFEEFNTLKIIVCLVITLLSIIAFIINIKERKQEAEKRINYEIAILDEIREDFEEYEAKKEKDNNQKDNKKKQRHKRKK